MRIDYYMDEKRAFGDGVCVYIVTVTMCMMHITIVGYLLVKMRAYMDGEH